MLGSFREKINTSLLNFFKHGFVFLAVNTEIKAMVDKVFKKKQHTHTHTQLSCIFCQLSIPNYFQYGATLFKSVFALIKFNLSQFTFNSSNIQCSISVIYKMLQALLAYGQYQHAHHPEGRIP